MKQAARLGDATNACVETEHGSNDWKVVPIVVVEVFWRRATRMATKATAIINKMPVKSN